MKRWKRRLSESFLKLGQLNVYFCILCFMLALLCSLPPSPSLPPSFLRLSPPSPSPSLPLTTAPNSSTDRTPSPRKPKRPQSLVCCSTTPTCTCTVYLQLQYVVWLIRNLHSTSYSLTYTHLWILYCNQNIISHSRPLWGDCLTFALILLS